MKLLSKTSIISSYAKLQKRAHGAQSIRVNMGPLVLS